MPAFPERCSSCYMSGSSRYQLCSASFTRRVGRTGWSPDSALVFVHFSAEKAVGNKSHQHLWAWDYDGGLESPGGTGEPGACKISAWAKQRRGGFSESGCSPPGEAEMRFRRASLTSELDISPSISKGAVQCALLLLRAAV